MDPYSPDTLRLVGNRTRLRSCRRICDDITEHGPASVAEIAKRVAMTHHTVLDCVVRMHRAGWVTWSENVVSCNSIIDPFPADL